jgi:hypothetical protein
MSSKSLLVPPTPQSYSPSSKSLNEVYNDQRKKTYASTPQGKAEVVYKDRQIGYLFKIAVYATLLFFILSNGVAFTTLNKLIATFTSNSNLIVDESGFPTLKGNLIHTGVFFVIIVMLLFFT